MIAGLSVAAFLVVALVQSLVALNVFPLPCDDLRAYLPMAHRLLDTNAIIEPWSLRRLQSLGGFTFLQALPVAVFGDVGIGVAEYVVGGTFLAGLFVANGWRTTWARVLALGLILTIPVLWVPRANTTAVLLATPLLVAALAAVAELRRAIRVRDAGATTRWAIAAGLLAGALASARTPLGGVATLMLAFGAVTVGGVALRARARVLAAVLGSAALAIAPWSFASWRSVGTPLYPLIAGNVNRSGPAANHLAVDGFSELARHAFALVNAGPYVWIALGVLVVTLLTYRALPDPGLIAIAALTVVGVIVAFAFHDSWESRLAFVRYVAPMAEGLGVFFLCEAIESADARAAEGSHAVTRRFGSIVAIAGALSLAFVSFSGFAIHTEYELRGDVGMLAIDQAAHGGAALFGVDAYAPSDISNEYQRALDGLRDPAHTILAVDQPYLVDYRRFDLPSLDFPGWAAPQGRFPFFHGPEAKLVALSGAGYTTLLATDPSVDLCLGPSSVRAVAPYDRYRKFYADWTRDLLEVSRRSPSAVRRFGSLMVIDLQKAQRALSQ